MSGKLTLKTHHKLFAALCVLAVIGYALYGSVMHHISQAYAADLSNRTVIIGSSMPGTTTNYQFNFNLVSTVTLGSIEFEYCSDSPFIATSCVAPAGLNLSGAALSSQSGVTGFTISGVSSANRTVLTKTAAAQVPAAMSYTFSNVVNPSTVNQPIYVRISLFTAADGLGTRTDTGAVVFEMANNLSIGAYVPPYLTMCIGKTVDTDCTTQTGSYLNLGLLKTTEPNVETSQYSVATNDPTGYSVAVLGNTMTAGNIVIPRLTTPQASVPGTSQFGINLRDNFSPDAGSEPEGIGTGTPASDYGIPDRFVFQSGDTISSSSLSTNFTKMTVSYLVNVSEDQPAGRYSTTLTYVGTAQF